MYHWNWRVISDYLPVYIEGALVTLGLTLLVVLAGTILGVLVGLMRRSDLVVFSILAKVYTELFRALPILVLLVWIFYVVPILFGLRLSPLVAAWVALSINLSAFVAETVRAGIEAIPRNQFESGKTLGLTGTQIMFVIILPQALRNMLPNLMGLYVTQLKNTSLASIIAVNELLHRSNTIISETFRPLEVYTGVALMYLAIILPFTALANWVEARLANQKKDTNV